MPLPRLLAPVLLVPTLLVSGLLTSTGCSGDDPSAEGSPSWTTRAAGASLDCEVSTSPGTLRYTTDGTTLNVEADGRRMALPRVAGGAGDGVLGTWGVPPEDVAYEPGSSGYEMDVRLEIEPGKLTTFGTCRAYGLSLTVAASSPARIASDTIVVEESHRRREHVGPQGRRVLEATSLRPAAFESTTVAAPVQASAGATLGPFGASAAF